MGSISWRAKDVGTIAGFLTAAECDEYIALAEARGFEEAPVTTGQGMVLMKDLRNNDRAMFDDIDRAQTLYRRLADQLASHFKKIWTPIGLNERLRLYRYDVGQRFDWHRDGYFERPTGERSFFTFMVYLNDDYEGGATSFANEDAHQNAPGPFRINPRRGMALLFHHPLLHRGDEVTSGRKYVLRTDVMYARRNAPLSIVPQT